MFQIKGITEDVDNTENELLKSAHFNIEEQIYNRIKSSPQSSHFILQNKNLDSPVSWCPTMTPLISRMPANTKIKTKINRKDYKKENEIKKKSLWKCILKIEVALSRVLNFGTPHFHTFDLERM